MKVRNHQEKHARKDSNVKSGDYRSSTRNNSHQETFDIFETGLEQSNSGDGQVMDILVKINENLSKMAKDRPSLVATAVGGISKQLILNNRELNNVAGKLDTVAGLICDKEQREKGKVSQMTEVKSSLGLLNQTMLLHHNAMIDMNRLLKDHTTVIKTQTPRSEAVLTAVTTALDTNTAALTSLMKMMEDNNRKELVKPHTVPLPSSVDRDRHNKEFDREWQHSSSHNSPRHRSNHRSRSRDKSPFRAPAPLWSNYSYRKSVERSVNVARQGHSNHKNSHHK